MASRKPLRAAYGCGRKGDLNDALASQRMERNVPHIRRVKEMQWASSLAAAAGLRRGPPWGYIVAWIKTMSDRGIAHARARY